MEMIEAASRSEKFWLKGDGDEVPGCEELKERVTRIGSQIAKFSDKPNLNYEFVILEKLTTASSYGRGKVGIGYNFLNKISSDRQLAAVLAHEIAHENLGHLEKAHKKLDELMKELPKFYLTLILTTELAAIAKWAKLRDTVKKGVYLTVIFNISRIAYEFYSVRQKFCACCKAMELEADALAFEYLRRAGYPPDTFMTVFDVIPKYDRPYHPSYELRKEEAHKVLAKL